MPGDAPQPPPPRRIFRIDVVAHQNKHASPDDKGWISVHRPGYTGPQARLHMPEQACGHTFVQKRMQHLFAFALLVGHQHFLAGFFLQEDRSGRQLLKILRPDLPSVDQRQLPACPPGMAGGILPSYPERDSVGPACPDAESPLRDQGRRFQWWPRAGPPPAACIKRRAGN